MKFRRAPIEVEAPEEQGYAGAEMNLAESSVRDRALGEVIFGGERGLAELVLGYGDHRGHRALRERIAAAYGGGVVRADDVLLTAGAAAALFIVATALLEPDERIVVARPNYASNIDTPRAIGAEIAFLEQRFEERFALDLDRLEGLVTARTRLVSLTSPHNPTGRTIGAGALEEIVALVEERGTTILLDETYRDLDFSAGGGAAPRSPPLAATLSPRAISVSSLSKTYGLPGIRVGWLICRDRVLMETFLAAKEQIQICGSVLDEEIAFRAFAARADWLPGLRARIAAARATVAAWIAREPRLEWIEPEGGVVCFPRIRPDAPVALDRFYATLASTYRTFVGPGPWFEMPPRFFRLGFGFPRPAALASGLANISRALDDARCG